MFQILHLSFDMCLPSPQHPWQLLVVSMSIWPTLRDQFVYYLCLDIVFLLWQDDIVVALR
jgi:hypothetical protein